MKIVITIDERGNPKVEIVKEDAAPANRVTTVEEIAKEVVEPKEVVKKVDPVEEIKSIVSNNKPLNFRDNYCYEALKEHSRVLPVFTLDYQRSARVYRPLLKYGYVNNWRQFIDFYNAGWITFGKENPFESINKSSCDITFFYGCVAWKDESRKLGYLLVELRGKFILLHLRRNG